MAKWSRKKSKAKIPDGYCEQCLFWDRVHQHVGRCRSQKPHIITPYCFTCQYWRTSEMQGDDKFDEWWDLYPKKKEKIAARKSFERVIKSGVSPDLLIQAVRHNVGIHEDPKFIKYPATWLNRGCYLDESDESKASKPIDTAGTVFVRRNDPRFPDLKERWKQENPGRIFPSVPIWQFPEEWL